ncbi:glycosyl transferase family 2 [Balneicella halophila]|uniref:Glycosyl transferase family 2 n=1 Tax=Balneicella halophila TaxID=1537566 RepID=A0A7L4UPA9_BALHA|nr:glycosyltransferase [Balneicella halophila]PVX49903.1 glycosyl transferase family 2 [Balneicella halophila]
MRVFNDYLNRQHFKPRLTISNYAPIIVVIPCYDEPHILDTLSSLWNNTSYDEYLLTIVVINQSSNSPDTVKVQNKKTLHELVNWKKKYETSLRTLEIIVVEFPKNTSGVGEARKLGMDEAINQYAHHQKDGIIVSLDADTLCENNYLSEIYRHFKTFTKTNTLIINYQHQLENLSEEQQLAIIQYELYLRYMTLAYRYVGHPNAFHTIGSAFAVKATAYCKQNGMNRRQAGEDFYFIQKMLQLGRCSELNSTCVYPSSRISNRVPFGTGKAIQELISNNMELQTHSFKAFEELKVFFNKHTSFYKITKEAYEDIIYNDLGGLIKSWLVANDFFKELEQINANCASKAMFSKKFFESFSIFQIIKYLNFTHTHFLQKVGIFHAIACLPSVGKRQYSNPEVLLHYLREELTKTTFIKG